MTHYKTHHRWLLLATITSALCACTSPESSPGWALEDRVDAREFDGGSPDVGGDDAELRDGFDAVEGGGPDADDGPVDDLCLVYDTELWLQPDACEGIEEFAPEDEPFAIPERDEMDEPSIRTAQQILREFGGLPEYYGWSIRPDKSLVPGPGRSFDLYSQPGQDVRLHLYYLNGADDLSEYRHNLTVMVDYKPVEAHYVRWNPERTEPWSDTYATGFSFPLRSAVEIVEVTLPGELFAEERMYELAVYFNILEDWGRGNADSRRFVLYNGGYSRPSHPCAEPRLGDDALCIERHVFIKEMATDAVALFYEGTTRTSLREVIEVQPGETRRFYASAFRVSMHDGPKKTVLVPVLNGEPIGPVWWVTQGERNEGSDWDVIDARKSFEVTFPDEPGLYDVDVATWEDPYEHWRTRDGAEHHEISDGSRMRDGSNALRFRVVAPSAQ